MGFRGVRVYGSMGVLVSGCLFSVGTCLSLLLGACLPACLGCLPARLGCLPAFLDQTELVVIFLFSSVRVGSVAQRILVGSRSGHSHSEMEGSRPALSRTGSGAPQRFLQRLYFIREGSCDLATDEPMATCAVWGGPARDERSDNSC